MEWATRKVNLLFGSFKKSDADDPETFTAGCLRLFTAYPREVVEHVVDPMTGLAGKEDWVPSLAKVKAALEARASQLARQREREDHRATTLADRARAAAVARNRRPTLDELRAKYGPNWGLTGAGGATQELDVDARRRRMELTLDANRRQFVKECKRAGVSPDAFISPTLAQIIRGGS